MGGELPATRHPPPATGHPPPTTHHPPPTTRHPTHIFFVVFDCSIVQYAVKVGHGM